MVTDPLWPRGKHPTYSAFVIEVGVRKDQDGRCRSYKRLQTPEDFEVVKEMGPSNGLEEGAWALLTEALRTEIMLQIIIRMSNDQEFKKTLMQKDIPLELVSKILGEDTLSQIHRTIVKIMPGLTKEALEQVNKDLRASTNTL